MRWVIPAGTVDEQVETQNFASLQFASLQFASLPAAAEYSAYGERNKKRAAVCIHCSPF